MLHLSLFIGRFHPLVVHLPIGILLVLAVLEFSTLLGRSRRLAWLPALGDGPRALILGCAAFAAALAAALGWMLAGSGEYDAELVHRHRLFGVGVAVLTALLLALHGSRRRRAYAGTFVAALAALMAAGHTGGTLTHGTTFLTEYLPARLAAFWGGTSAARSKGPPAGDPRRKPAYAAVIQPLLTERCGNCHGPAKTNGDLRLDSWAALVKGGKHGEAFKAGDAGASRLFQRISLAVEEKGHMPPKGKPQLTDDEVVLLGWWLDGGASPEKTLGAMAPAPEIASILANRLGLPAWGEPPPDRAATLAAGAALAARLGIIIRPLSSDGPWLAANARIKGRQFGDAELAQLAALGPALQRLDLGESAVTDRGLDALKAMPGLRRLDLDRTAVSDAGLARLAPLARLEYLNLYGTPVSDAGLAALRALPSLRSLYLWETRVTPAGADALAAHLTDRQKLDRWRGQMAELQNKIRAETFRYNLGASTSARPKDAIQPVAKTPTAFKSQTTTMPGVVRPAPPSQ